MYFALCKPIADLHIAHVCAHLHSNAQWRACHPFPTFLFTLWCKRFEVQQLTTQEVRAVVALMSLISLRSSRYLKLLALNACVSCRLSLPVCPVSSPREPMSASAMS